MSQLEALLKLGLTEAEARQVMEDDKRIDKGEKLFEFSEAQKAVEKKMRQADRTPTVYNFNKRERKPNEEKRDLITLLYDCVRDYIKEADDDCVIDIINPEREIEFIHNNKKYKIVLSCPRK